MTVRNVTRILLNRELRRTQGENQPGDAREESKVDDRQAIDKAHISSAAKEIHASSKTSSVNDTVRLTDKGEVKDIDQIKSRIVTGYYDRPEVIEEVATALLISSDLSSRPYLRQDKIDIAKERIEEGFYEQQRVIEEVASRMLDWLKR